MIEEITIRDLGVIEQATLPLGPGFTALTGETGAGKTMVVTALGLLLGQRAESGVVRAGASQAVAEGHWLLPAQHPAIAQAQDAGGSTDPAGTDAEGTPVETLLMSRSVSAEGRSRAWVGGRSAPAGVLAELGEQLVVVHGQSDQLRLRSQQAQREALDRFAGSALAEALARYRERFDAWQRRRGALEELTTERDHRRREAEELRAAIEEIEAVSPRPGEDAALAEQAERLTNLEELREAASAAHDAIATERLDEAVDAIGLVEQARRAVERVSAHDTALAPIVELLAGVSFQLSEAATQLAGYLDGLDVEAAGELDAVQERRAALASLSRRYGESIDEVLEYFDRAGLRLLELDGDDERIETLTAEVQADAEALDALASEVTALRSAAGAELAERVSEELAALAMPDARLVVEVDEREEFAAHGRDAVSILLQPHRGADPRPLGKGASGGELSRVMLAIEVVIASSDPVPTFVFDEVDAGVGGASAIEIGKRLARLAETAQVIVVTHLAQVAAFANNHLSVIKERGEVTASSVRQLEGHARLEEMARLLSGLSDSESALAHARELLDTASAATR